MSATLRHLPFAARAAAAASSRACAAAAAATAAAAACRAFQPSILLTVFAPRSALALFFRTSLSRSTSLSSRSRRAPCASTVEIASMTSCRKFAYWARCAFCLEQLRTRARLF